MSEAILAQILATLMVLQSNQQILSQKAEEMQAHHVNVQDTPYSKKMQMQYSYSNHSDSDVDTVVSPILEAEPAEGMYVGKPTLLTRPNKCITPARMNWGEADPRVRGPIIVTRDPSSMNI
ncbi:hypothetical protein BGZ80_005902, partial [Entomortierella chlamydospora]